MPDSVQMPPAVSVAALRLRDEIAKETTAVGYEALAAYTALSAPPKAVPGTRREVQIDDWRAVAGCDVNQKPDGALLLTCWALGEPADSPRRYALPSRWFAVSGSAPVRELSAADVAPKFKD